MCGKTSRAQTMYPTLESTIGNTPLVRLQRMPGDTTNVILGKLEGNNPAGSVKDRPALSMIVEAEKRGDIKPGDTLIEATSGNTGIALAMVAAMKGYRMILIMPDNLSLERRQSMTAFGAELILVTKAQGMEGARDLAERMRAEGKGVILDQFANPDNPLAHYRTTGPELWNDTQGRITHFVSAMGTTGTIMGVSRYPQGKESRDHDHRRAAGGRLVDSRHPQVARGVPAEDLRCAARRPHRVGHAAGGRRDDAPARARGRHLRRRVVGRRVRGRVAHRARSRATRRSCSSSATAATVTCRRVCSRHDADPRLRHRDGSRCRGHSPPLRRSAGATRRCRRCSSGSRRSAAPSTGNDFAPHYLQQVVAIACALRTRQRSQGVVDRRRRRSRARAHPPLLRRHREVHAAARVVERRRLRPAGAQSPRADPRDLLPRSTGTGATRTASSSSTATSAAITRAIST